MAIHTLHFWYPLAASTRKELNPTVEDKTTDPSSERQEGGMNATHSDECLSSPVSLDAKLFQPMKAILNAKYFWHSVTQELKIYC